MNEFLQAATNAINLHGISCTYTKVTNGTYDPNTGSVTNSTTDYTVKVYSKHLKATQFNYPNLIGKDAVLIYMVPSATVGKPDTNDRITIATDVYTVDSVQEHAAKGNVCLYRITAIQG